MYISTYCDRCVDLDDVGFFDQQLTCFVANLADLRFGDDLARAQLRDGPALMYQQKLLSTSETGIQYLSKSLIVALFARG